MIKSRIIRKNKLLIISLSEHSLALPDYVWTVSAEENTAIERIDLLSLFLDTKVPR